MSFFRGVTPRWSENCAVKTTESCHIFSCHVWYSCISFVCFRFFVCCAFEMVCFFFPICLLWLKEIPLRGKLRCWKGYQARWWFKNFLIFTPKIGEHEPVFTHIFQMGRFKHQPAKTKPLVVINGSTVWGHYKWPKMNRFPFISPRNKWSYF